MSFHSWLQSLCSILAPGQGQRQRPRRKSARSATYRPLFEALEDRLTLSFGPATSFPVGPNPQAVVTADFNNDGRLDLATANAGGNTVSVLLGDDEGGFGTAIASAVGGDPASLAAADFDKDGNLDLATVTQGRVSVLLGNGDGTFPAPTNYYVPAYALSVAMGDFNSDGNADLVVSAEDLEGFGVLQVALGNGGGGFTIANGVWIDYPCPGMAVGDLNGDGKLDAIAVPDGGVSDGFPLLGNGDGTFDPDSWYRQFVSGPDLRAVAVGDFTGDGIPDLVTAGQTVDVLRGHGDGWFDDPINHSANGSMHTGVVVADFNGDGHLDAVTADADTGTVSLMLGDGDGTLRYAGAFATGSSPAAVAVGDFNGDGRPDVATADADSNTVSVLLNDGTWTPPPPPPPTLRIADAPAVMEGNVGNVSVSFTVTLSAASTETITVAYATGNGTATSGDYAAASGTLTFVAGETSQTVTVLVIGDRLAEPNETFVVNLSGPTNATIADGQGVGTITDDEPRISISDVTKAEGKKGKTTLFSFTVTLSAAYDQPVTMSYRTVDGTAKASDQDYGAKTGTLTFAPGQTTKTITIEVKEDSKREASETFYLDLFGLSGNAQFTKNRGIGTILNDD